jgi:hypothetical protein
VRPRWPCWRACAGPWRPARLLAQAPPPRPWGQGQRAAPACLLPRLRPSWGQVQPRPLVRGALVPAPPPRLGPALRQQAASTRPAACASTAASGSCWPAGSVGNEYSLNEFIFLLFFLS